MDIEVRGGRLYAEDEGAGEPVLLLHAGVADRRVWDPTMPALAGAGFRALRYDVRGYGHSAPATEPFSLVADALAVLDAAGGPSAHFVGISQGAATSVDVALAAPDRVRSLALVAPGLTGHEWPRLPGYERRLAAAERDDMHALAVEIARLWAPLSFRGETLVPDPVSTVILDQAEQFMRDEFEVEEPDPRNRLGEIRVPTLIVLGADDVEEIGRIGDVLAAGIAGARRVVLADADHMLPLRQPDRFNDLVLTHLRGASG